MSNAAFQTRRFNDETRCYEDVELRLGVGDGVAYNIGCDAYPGTIRRVSPSGKTLWVSRDRFRANGQSDFADFEKKGVFVPQDVPESEWEKYTLRQDGRFRPAGSKCGWLSAGRRFAQDPHF